MRVQKVPLGLRSVVGAVGGGDTPTELATVVSPTLDLTNYYLATDLSLTNVGSTFTNLGDALDLVVPQGQVWRMVSLSAQATSIDTGAVVALALSLNPRNNLSDFSWLSNWDRFVWAGAASGHTWARSVQMPQPLVVQSGALFQLVCVEAAGAGSYVVELSAMYYELLS